MGQESSRVVITVVVGKHLTEPTEPHPGLYLQGVIWNFFSLPAITYFLAKT